MLTTYPPIKGSQEVPWAEPPSWLAGPLSVLPSWVRDKLYPESNPYTVEVMGQVITWIECIVPAFIPLLEAYRQWYVDTFSSWEGYTPITDPGSYTAPAEADPTPVQLSGEQQMWADVLYAGGEAHTAKTIANLILDRLPGGTTPPLVASEVGTNRLLAAIYYIAQLPFSTAIKVDDQAILDAITAAHETTDTAIGGLTTNVQEGVAAIEGKIDAQTELIDNVSGKVDETLAAVQALPTGGGGPGGWPGLGSATLSTPVAWSGPLEHAQAMDGCIVHITAEPGGTGKQTVGTHNSWQHAGWLAFISDNGDGDELQWLNLGDAVYSPKRMSTAAGVILFPRLGSSGTMTPWAKAT